MPYVAAIPDWFPTRKAAQATAFFAMRAGGKIKILSATKLLYLADRMSMERREHSITGDDYVSMSFGPVNTYSYSYMKGEASSRQAQWDDFIAPRAGKDLPLARAIRMEDLDELSRGDLRILDEIWESFGEIDRFDLAEWTHKYCPEWRDPGDTSIPISLSTIFARLRKDEPVELEEAIQADRALIAGFASK